jgi:hypothetical protein
LETWNLSLQNSPIFYLHLLLDIYYFA